jgi:hypothetical protein
MKMVVYNEAEVETWLFQHAQVLGHICDGVKGPLHGVEPGDPPSEQANIAYVDRHTGERIDVIYTEQEVRA